MATGEPRPDRDRHADRIDRLDPETLRLVIAFMVARANHGACEAGCEAAWERFHRACDPLFRRLTHRRGRGCWGVDDRVQELWRVMIERVRRYDPERRSFPSWLAAVVRHALADQDRSGHVLRPLDGEDELLSDREDRPEAACEQAEVQAIVTTALRELGADIPETTHRIILAHWVEGMSYEAIATDLGLSVKQVRDRHHRAVDRLRACLIRAGIAID